MNLTVKSSQAGSRSNPLPLPLPSFSICSVRHTLHSFTPPASIFFHVSLPPLRLPHNSTPVACAIDQASHHSLRSLRPYSSIACPEPLSFVALFFTSTFYTRLTFPSDEDRDTSFFHLYVTQMFPTYIVSPIHRIVSTLEPVPGPFYHGRSEFEREGTIVTPPAHGRDRCGTDPTGLHTSSTLLSALSGSGTLPFRGMWSTIHVDMGTVSDSPHIDNGRSGKHIRSRRPCTQGVWVAFPSSSRGGREFPWFLRLDRG